MYKLYGNNKKYGYELLCISRDIQLINETEAKILPKDYYGYIIVENNKETDNIIKNINFTKECEVEFIDNVKAGFNVNAAIVKPDKIRKEEKRKQAKELYEEYLKNREKNYEHDDDDDEISDDEIYNC